MPDTNFFTALYPGFKAKDATKKAESLKFTPPPPQTIDLIKPSIVESLAIAQKIEKLLAPDYHCAITGSTMYNGVGDDIDIIIYQHNANWKAPSTEIERVCQLLIANGIISGSSLRQIGNYIDKRVVKTISQCLPVEYAMDLIFMTGK